MVHLTRCDFCCTEFRNKQYTFMICDEDHRIYADIQYDICSPCTQKLKTWIADNLKNE